MGITSTDINTIIIVGGLPSDPRTWARDDVSQFLQYCEREFDLEKIDMEKFQMNGKQNIWIGSLSSKQM